MTDRICRTCRFAEWKQTNHKPPRPNRNEPGRCTVAKPRMPICFHDSSWRTAISFDNVRECHGWQAKEPR